MTALQLIIKKAKALRKAKPNKFSKWTDYVKAASATIKPKEKSTVGAVKKKAVKKAATKKVVKKAPVKKVIKKAATKKATSIHKDTKSHNVKISVMSGSERNDAERVLFEIEYWQKVLDKLRNEYKTPGGKMYKSSITADIRLAKKWLEVNKKRLKTIITKIK
jgi:type II secretory ATPase GspE/PulE/Tfp pilus assembly ATPase PilB-like protein